MHKTKKRFSVYLGSKCFVKNLNLRESHYVIVLRCKDMHGIYAGDLCVQWETVDENQALISIHAAYG